MTEVDVLIDAFERLPELVEGAVAGMDPAELNRRLDAEANTITWLLWHVARVLDGAAALVDGGQQAWEREWRARFALDLDDPDATGYGQSSEQVGRIQVGASGVLTGYHAAVLARLVAGIRGLQAPDLDRVVDTRWDPPVTLGVRLVSVLEDALQHVGQAALLRGFLLRARPGTASGSV